MNVSFLSGIIREPRIFVSITSCCALSPSQASTIITGKRLGKNVDSETADTIQKYCDAFDRLMQKFRDQVVLDAFIRLHGTGKSSDVLVT
jgi:hypothetical protein